MSDTNRENDPMDEFLSTLGDEPQETKVLRVPEVIPIIQRRRDEHGIQRRARRPNPA